MVIGVVKDGMVVSMSDIGKGVAVGKELGVLGIG